MLDEDFARWRDDPITRLVFTALGNAEAAQKQAWDDASWNGGMVRADMLRDTLNELRVRADCYAALRELNVETLKNWLGVEDAE